MPTELPKTYEPAAVEAEAIRVWTDERLFHAEPTDPGPPYSIVIPPPNVTAALHLGHALNNTLQDILTRAHRMMGHNTEWVPGTDHAGIATQTVVDKRLQAEGEPALKEYKAMEAAGAGGREKFLEKVHVWKDEYEARITEQLKRMGCSCDFDRQAFTMDEPRARAVREAFFQLFRDGLIYRGKRLVNWDPVSQTALADDEVEMEEVEGAFYYLRYPLIETPRSTGILPVSSPNQEHGQDARATFVTVATTRPETMLGDTAVAINPKDPRAAELRGRKVLLPIVNREIPIIEDDYVVLPVSMGGDENDPKSQFATGFLKVTPAHDPNDWEIGQRHNLEAINVMAPDASISDKHGWSDIGDAGFLVGKSREEARELIVKWFRDNGLLEEIKPYRHSVGHSYRSHVPIEPWLSDQWYCKVTDDRMRGAALRAIAEDQFDVTKPPTSPERERAGTPTDASTSLEHERAETQPVADAQGSSFIAYPVYFITFSCYGTWLHGDDRGSADREHNLPGTPYLIGDEERERREFASLKNPPASLDEGRRGVVHETIKEVCRHRGWLLLALNVRSNHVHAVVSAGGATPEKVMNDFKSYATRRLREAGRAGPDERLWTHHGSTRYLNDYAGVEASCKYVVDDQGAPLQPAPFDAREAGPERDSGITSPERQRAGVGDPAESPLPDPTSPERQRVGVGNPSGSPLPDFTSPERQRVGAGNPSGSPLPYGRGSLRFFPARYAKTFQTWHENIRDWCISRQLWWGHRIPVWSRQIQDSAGSPWDDLRGSFRNAFRTSGISDTLHSVSAQGDEGTWERIGCVYVWRYVADDVYEEYLCVPPHLRLDAVSGAEYGSEQEFFQEIQAEGFKQDPDVLDTWFSSGLWPMSTLGWPDTSQFSDPPSALNTWNPTSVLCTAREIITLWVSRMVMFNLYFLNRLPFRHVFIHAMIQDGHGQKMSKTLGNGLDPLDVINTHGADALRFAMASMATNTQDVRMPVDVIDPFTGEAFTPKWITTPAGHTVAAPVQESKKAGKKFVTSYGVASGQVKPTADMPVAKNTSGKFDLGRNFCNKLWNASRFVLMGLERESDEATKAGRNDESTKRRSDGGEEERHEGTEARRHEGEGDDASSSNPSSLRRSVAPSLSSSTLSIADLWILSRFNRTVADCNDALANYRFDQYAKACYDFFWRDFCDWYVEASKPAMKDAARAGQTSNVLASVLDGTLRLLHPMIPFITETIWWKLNDIRPDRGLPGHLAAGGGSPRLIRAPWPAAGSIDDQAEQVFTKLQEIIVAIRTVRNDYKVDPKKSVTVSIIAPADVARQIEEARETIEFLATCALRAVRPDLPPIEQAARTGAAGCDIFVEGAVDESAEQQRRAKRRDELTKQVSAMKGRLGNESYIAKAPPHLVQQTREQLAEAEAELAKMG